MITDNHFEYILDEALSLQQAGKSIDEIVAMFAGHEVELRAFLIAADETHFVYHDASKQACENLFTQLPSVSLISKPKNFWQRFYTILPLAGAVALGLFIFVGNHRQAVKYDLAPPLAVQTSNGGTRNGDLAASFEYKNDSHYDSQLGISYAVPIGLGATDIRATLPGRLLYGLAQFADAPHMRDTREFMRTNYLARIKTLHPTILFEQFKMQIRGYGGRIDGSVFDEEKSTLDFSVPKDSFDAFRTAIKNQVNARFITEQVDETNLLEQKQSIEEGQATQTNQLTTLQAERKTIMTQHQKTAAALQSQINSLSERLRMIQLQVNVTTNTFYYQQLLTERSQLTAVRAQLNVRLLNENSSYKNRLATIDSAIARAQTSLGNLVKQDDRLMSQVTMVQGTIMFEKISWFGVFILLRPYNWLLVGALVACYLFRRQHALPTQK